MQKLIDAINDIKEQICIIDIQIAKDASIGYKENKNQNETRYKLQDELSSLEAIYSTYLQENLADFNNETINNANSRNPTSHKNNNDDNNANSTNLTSYKNLSFSGFVRKFNKSHY